VLSGPIEPAATHDAAGAPPVQLAPSTGVLSDGTIASVPPACFDELHATSEIIPKARSPVVPFVIPRLHRNSSATQP
jgi:hypothetical protein